MGTRQMKIKVPTSGKTGQTWGTRPELACQKPVRLRKIVALYDEVRCRALLDWTAGAAVPT